MDSRQDPHAYNYVCGVFQTHRADVSSGWRETRMVIAPPANGSASSPCSANNRRERRSAARKYKRVVQVGTWQRSTKEFTDAINFIRTGKLGKIVLCRAWITDGTRLGRQKATAPPKGLDYDFWVGPARFEPYQSNRCHWNWRWYMKG